MTRLPHPLRSQAHYATLVRLAARAIAALLLPQRLGWPSSRREKSPAASRALGRSLPPPFLGAAAVRQASRQLLRYSFGRSSRCARATRSEPAIFGLASSHLSGLASGPSSKPSPSAIGCGAHNKLQHFASSMAACLFAPRLLPSACLTLVELTGHLNKQLLQISILQYFAANIFHQVNT